MKRFILDVDEKKAPLTFRDQLRLLKYFIRYYGPHKLLFRIDILSSLLNSGFTILVPLVVYKAINTYLPAMDMNMLLLSLCGLATLMVLMAVSDYVSIRWGHVLGVRMEADMRTDLFTHLQKLSFSYFDKVKTGHIMSRISNDLTMIAELAHHGPEDLLSASLLFIGAFSVMFYLNPMLTLLTVLPLPLIILWGAFFQKRMMKGFRQLRKEVAEINSQVENSIQGVREIKSYTNEQYAIDKFQTVNKSFVGVRENVFNAMAYFHSGIMFLMQSYSLLFIAAGMLLMYYNKATLVEIMAFFMYSKYITMPVFRLVSFIEQFQQGITAFERFHEVMMVKPDISDRPDAISPSKPLSGDIEFSNVFFKYQDMKDAESWVLNEISMKIEKGKTVALVGESGAGKTTLASLLPRFYDITSGTLKIDGIEVSHLKQECLRKNIGIVQQTPFLFDSTIRENILFGRPDASEEELIQAAKDANIYDFVMSLPDKFDSLTGEHGVKLSGGQRQRISIARVFLKNPPILIFDEATSSLDNQSEALIQESMERLCRNRTTIIIAHRLSTVKKADYIYCLLKGKLIEQGTHTELLERKGYYHDLYMMHTF